MNPGQSEGSNSLAVRRRSIACMQFEPVARVAQGKFIHLGVPQGLGQDTCRRDLEHTGITLDDRTHRRRDPIRNIATIEQDLRQLICACAQGECRPAHGVERGTADIQSIDLIRRRTSKFELAERPDHCGCRFTPRTGFEGLGVHCRLAQQESFVSRKVWPRRKSTNHEISGQAATPDFVHTNAHRLSSRIAIWRNWGPLARQEKSRLPTRIFLPHFVGVFAAPNSPRTPDNRPGSQASDMNKLAALLIASTALTTGSAAYADVYTGPQEEPFFWTETDEDPAVAPAPAPAFEPAPATAPAPQAPQANPMLEAYPVSDAPRHAAPEAGRPRYLDGDCYPAEKMPATDLFSADKSVNASSPEQRRRGEMAGDDGVLEAIQDDPCAYIHRRGGETAESARGYTDPDDIRRVNVLEDRRIPVHDVGRYAPEGEGLWHSDANNPYVDSAQSWTVEKGMMLSEVLIAWGEQAGFDVIWRSPHDFVIRADVTIRGTFPEAAGQVLESFSTANPPIAGELYLANRVLVVDSGLSFDGN